MVSKAYPFHAFKIQSIIGNSKGSSDCSCEGADVSNILSLKGEENKSLIYECTIMRATIFGGSTFQIMK